MKKTACSLTLFLALLTASLFSTSLKADEEPLDQRLQRAVEACLRNDRQAMREFATLGDAKMLSAFFTASPHYQGAAINYAVAMHLEGHLSLRQQTFAAIIGEVLHRNQQLQPLQGAGISVADNWSRAKRELLDLRERALAVLGQGNDLFDAMRDALTILMRDASHLMYDPSQRSISQEFGNPLHRRVFDRYVQAVFTILDILHYLDPTSTASTWGPTDESPREGGGIRWEDYLLLDERLRINFETTRTDLVRSMFEPLLASNHRHLAPQIIDQLIRSGEVELPALRESLLAGAARSPITSVRQLGYLAISLCDAYESWLDHRGEVELAREREAQRQRTAEANGTPFTPPAYDAYEQDISAARQHELTRIIDALAEGRLAIEAGSLEEKLVRLIRELRSEALWVGDDASTIQRRQEAIRLVFTEALTTSDAAHRQSLVADLVKLAAAERTEFGLSVLEDPAVKLANASPAGFSEIRDPFALSLIIDEKRSIRLPLTEALRLTAVGKALLDKPLATSLIDRGDGTFSIRPEHAGAVVMQVNERVEAARAAAVRATYKGAR